MPVMLSTAGKISRPLPPVARRLINDRSRVKLMAVPVRKAPPRFALVRARQLGGRVLQILSYLWSKPAIRTGLVLVALAAILFNSVFFHVAAMPEGILQPATDEPVTLQPAYQVAINGELPPES